MHPFVALITWPVAVLTAPLMSSTSSAVTHVDSTTRAADTSHTASLSARLASITTDTGAFAPGERDFTRYTTPGWCLAAVARTSSLLRHTLAAQAVLDTLLNPLQDTLGFQAIAALAHACGQRFSVASASPADLPILSALGNVAGDDALTSAALARVLAAAPTTALQDTIRQQAIRDFLIVHPANVTAAERVVAQIDALGSAAQDAQMRAHASLVDFWQQVGDTSQVRHEAERIIALGQTIPPQAITPEGGGVSLIVAVKALLAQAYATHPAAMPQVADQARQVFSRLAASLSQQHFVYHITKASSTDAIITQLAPDGYRLAQRDTLAPTLQADVWFPTHTDTVRPLLGKVNLIIGGAAAQQAALVKHVLARYGSAGLVVTVVDIATGDHLLLSGAGLITDGAQTVSKMAQWSDWYYRTYEGLPVTVAVRGLHATFRPPPDGLRVCSDVATLEGVREHSSETCPEGYQDGNTLITGRDGRLLYTGNTDWGFLQDPQGRAERAALEHVIQTALTMPIVPAGSQAGGQATQGASMGTPPRTVPHTQEHP